MGDIMHDTTHLDGKIPLEFTKEELLKLMEIIPDVQAFCSYVISEWVPKCKMWVMGNWNLHMPAMIIMLPLKATMQT
jgi:hypothetical protein